MVSKYLVLFVAVMAYCVAQGHPLDQAEEFRRQMRKFQEDSQRQFEEFQRKAQENFQHLPELNARSLPHDGKSHVYGESQSTYHVESDVNGKHSEESGGHKVINNDGKITEYDLP